MRGNLELTPKERLLGLVEFAEMFLEEAQKRGLVKAPKRKYRRRAKVVDTAPGKVVRAPRRRRTNSKHPLDQAAEV